MQFNAVPPGRPRITLTDGDIRATSLTARWSAPPSDGGRPVTGYRVVVVHTVKNVTLGNVLHTDVDQLEINTRYSVEVTAINVAGAGKSGTKDITTKSPGTWFRSIRKTLLNHATTDCYHQRQNLCRFFVQGYLTHPHWASEVRAIRGHSSSNGPDPAIKVNPSS